MRVCFVSYHACPLFDPTCQTPIGGAETHAWMLASGLSQCPGFEVHFVVQAPRWFGRRQVGHVTIWNVGDGFDPIRRFVSEHVTILDRWPWLQVRRWRFSLLWKIPLLAGARLFKKPNRDSRDPHPVYDRIAADVVCCFGVSGHAATAIASARRHGARTLLFLESNSDLDQRFTADSQYVTPNGEKGDICDFVLKSADRIISQTAIQQKLLQERRGRDSKRMSNAIDLEWWDRMSQQPSRALAEQGISEGYVLWIGRADTFHKRPELCLELARLCPGIRFVMILNPGDEALEKKIKAEALGNVTFISQVPYEEMPAVLSRAAVYLSTGSREYEGAPNVFLQAGASGVPILSLEVSTELLEETPCGTTAGGDLHRLAESPKEYWNDPAARH
jgi:glycosyltransferase involved in cell wall biosynthesis